MFGNCSYIVSDTAFVQHIASHDMYWTTLAVHQVGSFFQYLLFSPFTACSAHIRYDTNIQTVFISECLHIAQQAYVFMITPIA